MIFHHSLSCKYAVRWWFLQWPLLSEGDWFHASADAHISCIRWHNTVNIVSPMYLWFRHPQIPRAASILPTQYCCFSRLGKQELLPTSMGTLLPAGPLQQKPSLIFLYSPDSQRVTHWMLCSFIQPCNWKATTTLDFGTQIQNMKLLSITVTSLLHSVVKMTKYEYLSTVVICYLLRLCPTLLQAPGCSPPDSSVLLSQTRILEWVADSFSGMLLLLNSQLKPHFLSWQENSLPLEEFISSTGS